MSRINRVALPIAVVATLFLLYLALLAPVPEVFRRGGKESATEPMQLARHLPPPEKREAEEKTPPPPADRAIEDETSAEPFDDEAPPEKDLEETEPKPENEPKVAAGSQATEVEPPAPASKGPATAADSPPAREGAGSPRDRDALEETAPAVARDALTQDAGDKGPTGPSLPLESAPAERAVARPVEAAPGNESPRPEPPRDPGLDEAMLQLSELLDDSAGVLPASRPEPGRPRPRDIEDSLAELAALFPEEPETAPSAPPRTAVPPMREPVPSDPFHRAVESLERFARPALEDPAAPEVIQLPGETPPLAGIPETSHALERQHEALRSLARDVDTERAVTLFRLEPQDPDDLRRAARQYGMDVLITSRVDGHHSLIRLTQRGTKPGVEASPEELESRYGLSIRGVRAPWLERIRKRYVSTRLISRDAVEVMLLVPRRESRVILGRIRADTERLGHPLDDLTACWGTFVELPESAGAPVYDYRVTRLVFPDGREKHTEHWRKRHDV